MAQEKRFPCATWRKAITLQKVEMLRILALNLIFYPEIYRQIPVALDYPLKTYFRYQEQSLLVEVRGIKAGVQTCHMLGLPAVLDLPVVSLD